MAKYDFSEIYRTYFSDVMLYIRRLSGSEHIAEEITSQTFFKAMNSIETFRGDCDIRVWLCQIAKNNYYSYLQKSRKVANMEDAELKDIVAPDAFVDEEIIQKEEAGQIRNILHALPNPYKEVFMWRVFADLNFKQIGELFQKNDNWACVTYHRARKMIKGRLEEINNEK